MAKKIIIPEEELHNIADAINNRADYLDDINNDTYNRDHLVETTDRQMYSNDMASNILRLRVNLSRYYTKEEIDQMFADGTIDMEYVSGSKDDIPIEDRSERVIYVVNDGDRYTVWAWHEEEWIMLGGDVLRSDLDNYYTKEEIDECCESKQDKLIPGDRITITQDNVISANIDRSYKFEATLEDPVGGVTQGTLAEVDNPDNDPIFAIIGQSPVYISIDPNDMGYVVINIDPDALEGSLSIPLNDDSRKVATTKFVGQKIQEAIDNLPDYVEYIIFNTTPEEEVYPHPKEYGKIYANKQTKNVYFGDILLNSGLVWNILSGGGTDYVYMLYYSGFQDVPDEVVTSGVESYDYIPNYTEQFYNPWQTNQFVPLLAASTADPSTSEIITSAQPVSQLLQTLNITEYGDEEHPALTLTPNFSSLGNCPFYGWSANGGDFAFISMRIASNTVYEKANYRYDADKGQIVNMLPLLSNIPTFDGQGEGEAGETVAPYYPGHTLVSWGDAQTVDWSWTGSVDAQWEEIIYDGINDVCENYQIDLPTRVIENTGSHNGVVVYDYADEYEGDPEDISYRYATLPIAQEEYSGSYTGNWLPESNGIYPDDLIDAEFTREEFKERVENAILNGEDWEFYSASALNPIVINNLSSPTFHQQHTIFAIYIQGYIGTGDDIRVVSNYIRILKGWPAASDIIYGINTNK